MAEQIDAGRRETERAHAVHKEFVVQHNTASIESGHSSLRAFSLINGERGISLRCR
jgi:hypothetical protein